GQELRGLVALEAADVAHRRRALARRGLGRTVERFGRVVPGLVAPAAAAGAGAGAARLVVVALREVAGALVRLAQLGGLEQALGLRVERVELLGELALRRAQRLGLLVELLGIRERIDLGLGHDD